MILQSGPENEHDMSEEEDDDSRISNNSPRPPEMKFNPAMIDPEMISKLKQVKQNNKLENWYIPNPDYVNIGPLMQWLFINYQNSRFMQACLANLT